MIQYYGTSHDLSHRNFNIFLLIFGYQQYIIQISIDGRYKMVERNIIIGKVGGTAGKNSVNYKISLPADMVKELGITPEDRAVTVEMENKKIVIKKKEKS